MDGLHTFEWNHFFGGGAGDDVVGRGVLCGAGGFLPSFIAPFLLRLADGLVGLGSGIFAPMCSPVS